MKGDEERRGVKKRNWVKGEDRDEEMRRVKEIRKANMKMAHCNFGKKTERKK